MKAKSKLFVPKLSPIDMAWNASAKAQNDKVIANHSKWYKP